MKYIEILKMFENTDYDIDLIKEAIDYLADMGRAITKENVIDAYYEIDDYYYEDGYDEMGFDPYAGCYTYDC